MGYVQKQKRTLLISFTCKTDFLVIRQWWCNFYFTNESKYVEDNWSKVRTLPLNNSSSISLYKMYYILVETFKSSNLCIAQIENCITIVFELHNSFWRQNIWLYEIPFDDNNFLTYSVMDARLGDLDHLIFEQVCSYHNVICITANYTN